MHIRELETILVDLPTIRAHRLANQTVTQQTLVILRLRTSDGLEGLGEATTIGGLSYGDEAPETIKVALDTYIAPLLVGQDVRRIGQLMALVERHVKGNRLAKSAVETALLDVSAKLLGIPVSALFGGARTDELEVAWGLATGDAKLDIEEAERALAEGRHRLFKIKVGGGNPHKDTERVAAVKAALGDRASVRIDANQAWDEPTARMAIGRLEFAGIDLIEQPVNRNDRARSTPPEIAASRSQ